MPEENKSTHGFLEERKTPINNTLGMEQDEYEAYQRRLIEEYANDPNLSLRAIVKREQERGIKLYQDRLTRWITKAGVEIKSSSQVQRNDEFIGKPHSLYLSKVQYDMLKQYDNMSQIMRAGIDIVLGIHTKNIVLFLGEGKNVVFIIDGTIEAYITDELTEFEERTIQTLINKAKMHGPRYIINFAIENGLNYYGGDKLVEEWN